MKHIKETRPPRHNRADTRVNSEKHCVSSERLWQRAQDLHRSKPDGISVLRGEVDTTQKLSPKLITARESEISFLTLSFTGCTATGQACVQQ